tara:strand:- start:136 stop:984 length:849 start_codon:yes stop_codon:yes gene_type:complete
MKHNVTKDGLLIDELKLIYPDRSMNKIRALLTNNRVLLDGVVVHEAKREIFNGQKIEIKNKILKKKKLGFEIIYEDEYLIVVNKPQKLLSVSTNKLEDDTMHSRVLNYIKNSKNRWIWIVHRLDKDTSGLMIFAKSESVKKQLQKMFSNNSITRIYYAIVEGIPYEQSGRIENYIVEGKNLFVRECKKSTIGSRKAITNWMLLRNNNDFSLLKIIIETGRRNQIRVHLAGIKCPVVGDKKYSNSKHISDRLALHAGELELLHPVTNEKITFKCEHNFRKIYT